MMKIDNSRINNRSLLLRRSPLSVSSSSSSSSNSVLCWIVILVAVVVLRTVSNTSSSSSPSFPSFDAPATWMVTVNAFHAAITTTTTSHQRRQQTQKQHQQHQQYADKHTDLSSSCLYHPSSSSTLSTSTTTRTTRRGNNRATVTLLQMVKSQDSAAASAQAEAATPDAGGASEQSSSTLSPASAFFQPSNEASTTTEFLAGLWELIAQGNSMVKGESKTVLFPNMESRFESDPQYLNLITAHLDACKDVCDYFGILTTVQPYFGGDNEKGGGGNALKGFTVKSFRSPDHDPDKFEFDYDPFWDDGDDWNYEGIDDEYEAEEREASEADASFSTDTTQTVVKYPDVVNKIPDDDDEIISKSKSWVAKICSDMGICPFTSGADQAGLPIGPVYYTIDRSTSMEDMYACYWKEVVRVEQQPESDLSTTLLVVPEFCIDNVEIFESFSTTLTQPLSALGVEDAIQLVFFHPHWSFRDGGERGIGEGMAANYARRSPWPMINILRTNQVRAAQKGIPTGLVYKQNEKTLSSVGVDKLETMLRLRDWSDIADVKVDRREMEALRVAQDFQKTGVIKNDDKSFANDATPAANKVDETQVEQGDLVNVIIEALGKRLGRPSTSSSSGTTITRLSGPETSATIMASDFLLAELRRICNDSDKATDDRQVEDEEAITTTRSEYQPANQQDGPQPIQSPPAATNNDRKTRFDITAQNNEGEQPSPNAFF